MIFSKDSAQIISITSASLAFPRNHRDSSKILNIPCEFLSWPHGGRRRFFGGFARGAKDIARRKWPRGILNKNAVLR